MSQGEANAPVAGPPTGSVTFVFSDIEGSTVRWELYGDAMQQAVRRHDDLVRDALLRRGGYVFKTMGDAFCAVFGNAADAALAAVDAQRTMLENDWSGVNGLNVRVAIHAGTAEERDGDYFGPTVNRVARLLSVAHGGQIVVSASAHEALLAAGAPLRFLDLGAHRLRDLVAEERVYQLVAPGLPLEFPPLRSLDALPNNLPSRLGPFVGREEELRALRERLDASRLVTIVGAGGVGKTRTALAVAAELVQSERDGVWFVDLARIEDPGLVPSAIADVFDVADAGSSRPLIDALVAQLRSRRMLLVVDNCEHVVTGAADAVERLLQHCPQLRVLATSREALAISGEETYRMPSLALPPEGPIGQAELRRYSAATLFMARARAVQQSFVLTDENASLVAQIVRRLDGIPLAIELAASRVRTLNLFQIAQRLNERFTLLAGGSRTALPRHQTLAALIGWSYDLLDEAERSLLAQLAVFRGGWTLDAASAICKDARFEDWDVFELLAALASKSLVVADIAADETRYRLLESTREFALERLKASGLRGEAATRHCRYFRDAAVRAEEAVWENERHRWIDGVRTELENYRAAIAYGLGEGFEPSAAATIVAALSRLWYDSLQSEGRALAARAESVVGENGARGLRGRLLLARAQLEEGGARKVALAEQALTLLTDGDDVARIQALITLASARAKSGNLDDAIAHLDEALALSRRVGKPRLVATVLDNLSAWLVAAGRHERARNAAVEAAAIWRACGERLGLGAISLSLAELRFAEGDARGALSDAAEAYRIFKELGSEAALATIQSNRAAYLLAIGDAASAWDAAGEALRRALGQQMTLQCAIAIGHLAHVAAVARAPETAARLLGYVDAVYAREGSAREPTEERGRAQTLALLESALAPVRLAGMLAVGAGLDEAAAVAEALAVGRPAESEGGGYLVRGPAAG